MDGFEEFLAVRGVQRSLISQQNTTRYDHVRYRPQGRDTFDSSEDEYMDEGEMIQNISNDNEVQADGFNTESEDGFNPESEDGFDTVGMWSEENRTDDRSDNGDGYVSVILPQLANHDTLVEHPMASMETEDFASRFGVGTNVGEVSNPEQRLRIHEDEISEDFDSHFNAINFTSSGISRSTISRLGQIDRNYKYTEKPSSSVKFKYPILHDKANFIYSPPVRKLDRDSSYQVKIERDRNEFLLQQAPAEKFHNGLKLRAIGETTLTPMKDCMRYRNNLSCIFSQDSDYLVIGVGSWLNIYDFDPIKNLPNGKPRLRFDTKPSFSSTTDQVVSTWPHFPHGINFIRSCQFLGKTVVCACVDDGRLLIWFAERFIEQMKPLDPSGERDDFRNLAISPDFKLRLSASVWGLDIRENIIVASDNSQSVVLLFYHELDGRFYHVKSQQVLHNVPSVSIVKYTEETIHVACASISGELIIFEFHFVLNAGPLDKSALDFFTNGRVYYTDPLIESLEYGNGDDDVYRRHRNHDLYDDLISRGNNVFKRVCFQEPLIVSRCVLNEDCWTVQPFHHNWFLPVGSLQSVFGDCEIDDEKEQSRIIAESAILKGKRGHKSHEERIDDSESDGIIGNQTSLGVAAKYQFYKSESIDFNGVADPTIRIPPVAKMTNISDEYKRIHRDFILYEKRRNLVDDFLVVTTSKKAALFKYPSLYCPCATNPLFNLDLGRKQDSCYSNRLSISAVIPELSCFIAVSQQGMVTIMRLCTYRGVYGMRQEHVFPNAFRMAVAETGDYRSIVGLSVREKGSQEGANNGDCDCGIVGGEKNSPSFLLHILYDDGTLFGYDLKE
ncbi:CRT10 family protein [Candida parapsilosis]|uniref:Uncharacterized protein n=2 Tax=Candida parapsilosis TaxID=5480 RepID=G8B4Y0_CANPC|nr:uncharacterized protein CPAR2_600880 [Candida parapsilosis]KAF6043665.1 CRT10 family protein [Candida parapsilosis]KAF6043838.1 CRT10 family protein [Candida parapsilosis]KAF6045542.1 CRT10 family protein [Candida parapsilosis]KAF6060329.1 CRT10 family protein [Candida parapsilosis]KAI5905437.1 Protein CRT10 [Candida parapsilosis]